MRLGGDIRRCRTGAVEHSLPCVVFGKRQLVLDDAGFHSVAENAGQSKHVTFDG